MIRRDRFPVADLIAAMRSKPRDDAHLAAMLGKNKAAVNTARLRGLSERQADEWACALGVPPESVWHDYLAESATEREERIFQGLRLARPDMAKEAC